MGSGLRQGLRKVCGKRVYALGFDQASACATLQGLGHKLAAIHAAAGPRDKAFAGANVAAVAAQAGAAMVAQPLGGFFGAVELLH
jgi:hypothetical protein